MRQTKKGISLGKGEGKDKLLVISSLDVQTMGLNGLEAPYPQFLLLQNTVDFINITNSTCHKKNPENPFYVEINFCF